MSRQKSQHDQENINIMAKRTPKERKQCYRNLLNQIEDIQESEDLSLQTVKEINGVLQEVNSLDDECPIKERVKHADETLLDSIVLSSASHILVKCIESVDVSKSSYDPNEFRNKIEDAVKRNEEYEAIDIKNLLQFARSIIPENPKYTFLFGTFDPKEPPVPKQLKVRQRKEAEAPVQVKKLQKVVNAENDEEGIDEIVNFLQKVLREEYVRNNDSPIQYYDYVIDKTSFGNTVENIFYTSFLIRDGKARLGLDNQGNPTIEPLRKRDLKEFRNAGGTNTQIITSITMDEWQKFGIQGHLERHKKLNNSKK